MRIRFRTFTGFDADANFDELSSELLPLPRALRLFVGSHKGTSHFAADRASAIASDQMERLEPLKQLELLEPLSFVKRLERSAAVQRLERLEPNSFPLTLNV